MRDDATLNACAIEVRYDAATEPVLAGFSLDLRRGELVGVVGPNGSGKSTLVRALSRALRPAAGMVLLAGDDLYAAVSARGAAQRIGVVPQDTQVAFDFSVREVVEMGRAPRLPRRPFAAPGAVDAQAVTEALRRVGVADLADRAVTTLSGGERQRILLARALAQDTEVLLLDEPTAHLDLRHQGETLALARALAHDEGKAVLAVLHDLNLASAFCDRLVLLHHGAVAAQGTPEEVLTAENLRRVYGVNAWVRRDSVTGRPVLTILPNEVPLPGAAGRSVFVLCGGGSGSPLLFALAGRGCRVTVGALASGDPDADACDRLAIPAPRAAPFAPLPDIVIGEMSRMAMEAAVVVLTSAPLESGNIVFLEIALAARDAGTPAIAVRPHDVPSAAQPLWEQLVKAGAIIVADNAVALDRISADF